MEKDALLIIGDRKVNRKKVSPSFLEFVEYAQRIKNRSFELKVMNYSQLLSGKIPAINARSIKIVFFFPYTYWNRYIEVYRDRRVYGDEKFGREFKSFFKKIKRSIDKYYRGKCIKYLNHPEAYYLDRDKRASKYLLQKNAVPTPRIFRISSFDDIQRLLKRGVSLYIKPRFGALGKGITYINEEGIISNFLFRKGQIVSRPYDYNWRFSWIREERKFLKALLKRKVICEEAIRPAIFRKKRFDFRVYVIFGKVVYLYAKSAPATYQVTNWSQGGKIDKKKKILQTLPKKKIDQVVRLAQKASSALGLNFCGIDVIFSHDLESAYVLEGNAFPGYEKGFDLMKCLLNLLVK